MRQAVSQPRCPLKKGHGGEGCRKWAVSLHTLPTVKQITSNEVSNAQAYQPNPGRQLIPPLPEKRRPLALARHSDRQAQGGAQP